MARTDSGPSFAQRVDAAGLTPQQRETAAPILLLAELVDELCGLTRQQVAQLDEQNDRLAEQNRLLADLRDGRRGERTTQRTARGPASGSTDEGKEGGKVRITEPATPPPDPDEGPENTGGDGAVAEPATGPAATGGTAAKKAARTAAPTKKTTAAARRPGGASGKG